MNLPVEVEAEAPYLSVFPVIATRLEEKQVVLFLGMRHTACLAEDVCFVRLATINRGLLGYLDALSGDKRGELALREAIRRANASGFAIDALDGRALLAQLMVERGDRGGAWRELEHVLQQAQSLRYARVRSEAREMLDALRAKVGPASSKRSP
jgi:hypothetical protein